MADALKVKGFAWLNLLQFVNEQHGASTREALIAAFPGHEAQFEIAGVLPIGWFDGALHLGVLEWLAKNRYGNTSEGARLMGFEIAQRNVSHTFRSFARLEDLQVALQSTELAFRQFYSQGTMRLTLEGAVLEARLTDFPLASETFGNVLGAGLVAFLRGGHVDASLLGVEVGDASIVYRLNVVVPPLSRATPVPV